MSVLVFEVGGGLAKWVCGDTGEVFEAGEHTVEFPSADLVRCVSASHDANVGVIVTEGLDETAFQSQEDGEAANAEAVASGEWREANIAQFAIDKAAQDDGTAEMVILPGDAGEVFE